MEKEEMKRGVWGVTTQVVVRRLYIIYGCNTGQQSLHVVQSSSSIYARRGRPIFLFASPFSGEESQYITLTDKVCVPHTPVL